MRRFSYWSLYLFLFLLLSLVWLAKSLAIGDLITGTKELEQILANLRVKHHVVVTHFIKLLLQQLFHLVKHLNWLIVKDRHHVREELLDLTSPGDHN